MRLALPYVLSKVCFFDLYPSSATRAAWNRKALMLAAIHLKNSATQNKNAHVAYRYEKLRERLKVDEDYTPTLGRIVCPDICSIGPH